MNTAASEIRELVQQLLRFAGNSDKMTCSCMDVTPLQGVVLIKLAEQQPMNMQQIANEAYLTISTMSRVVNKLVDAGLVIRHEDGNDRRIVLCSLTDSGTTKAKAIEDGYNECFEQLAASISPQDLEGFLRGMKIIVQQMESYCNPGSCSSSNPDNCC